MNEFSTRRTENQEHELKRKEAHMPVNILIVQAKQSALTPWLMLADLRFGDAVGYGRRTP